MTELSTPKTSDRDAVAALLAVQGCPYAAGTVESVVWLQGYQAAVEMVTSIVQAANLGQLAPFRQPLQ